MASQYEESLHRAASTCGIEPEFWDIFGHRHVASVETLQAIVRALGLSVGAGQDGHNELEKSLRERAHAEWSRVLPPVLVVSENAQPLKIGLRLPESARDQPAAFDLVLEGGTAKQFFVALESAAETGDAAFTEGRYIRKDIALPVSVPLGYHTLHVEIPGLPSTSMRLIVTPDKAFLPNFLQNGGKSAGIAVTLYGLRSARNWGVGDFRDLQVACDWAAQQTGVSFLALNPLHAIHNRQPYNASPYLPNSVFYQNFLYLDVEAIEDFENSPEAQALWQSAEIQKELEELRASEFVLYERASTLKLRFLKLAFAHFQEHAEPFRALQFSVFVKQEGELLRRFATYCALDEHLRAQNPDLWVWTDWPAGYQDPQSEVSRAFQQDHAGAILFFKYLQWHCDQQLSEAQEHARSAGLGIGLYHDLALATDRCGSDLWGHRPFYVSGCRVGSPPDDFSPQGQDWAFPPPNGNEHRANGYQLFVDSIRKTCRHGGALRIDHVMRFFRLYWIPDGVNATAGAYVREQSEDLVRILALESVRNQVLIVGEDLGTVEPRVRETLARFGILSYRLFYFERNEHGNYKAPHEYPQQALVSSTTHDLPTIAGFWINQDIEARHRAGVLDEAGYRSQLGDRAREKQKMLNALFAAHLLPDHVPRDATRIPELTGELHNAIIGFLASTPSMLMVLNQEDLTKEVSQQNLPGTTWQHPNWSRKMKFTLEQLQSDPQAAGFLEMFRHWLRRTGRVSA